MCGCGSWQVGPLGEGGMSSCPQGPGCSWALDSQSLMWFPGPPCQDSGTPGQVLRSNSLHSYSPVPLSQEGSSVVTMGEQHLSLAPDDSLLVPAGNA